jgi:uncharacterized protein YxjI
LNASEIIFLNYEYLLKIGLQIMDLSEKTNFVLKHEQMTFKDSISVLQADMELLCIVNCDFSWKMPKMWNDVATSARMRATDVRLTRKNGELIGEIHEIPTGTLRLIRKWEVYDEKGAHMGVVVEKPKFIGSDWILESVDGNPLAYVEGDRKKHNYELITAEKNNRKIARCSSLDKDSYKLEILASNIDPFLVLCYIIVLDIVKTVARIKPGSHR